MAESKSDQRVAAVRRFNRFYTRKIGLLHEGYLASAFSLTEGRVLYELAHQDNVTAGALGRELGLDPGYLSRIVRGFEKRGLLERTRSKADGRQSFLALTRRGHDAFAPLHTRSRDEIGAMLGALPAAEQDRLVEAMRVIEGLLGARPEPKAPYMLRPHQPGDMGWVIHRHGVLYAREYGFDERFEAMVAEIAARFRPALRSEARALLDGREGRRDRRLGLPRRPLEDRGPAPAPARRAGGARPRHRRAPRRRVRALRAPGGLPEDHALDQ